jgi:hypothetical protein
VIRRHPDIKLTRQPDDIAALALLQGELLDALWKTLEVGGILLYATCSTCRPRTPKSSSLPRPHAGRPRAGPRHRGRHQAAPRSPIAGPGRRPRRLLLRQADQDRRRARLNGFKGDWMKIIILGAGQVGGSLAEHLASEANDITVVDTDGERLRDLGDRLDIRTVQGRGSLPTVLRQAGADDADMLVAVTNSDETNMVACQVAHPVPHPDQDRPGARSGLPDPRELFDNEAIPVDVLISPEQVVTNYIKRLIEHPAPCR